MKFYLNVLALVMSVVNLDIKAVAKTKKYLIETEDEEVIKEEDEYVINDASLTKDSSHDVCYSRPTIDQTMECANGDFVSTPPWDGCIDQGSVRVRCPQNHFPCNALAKNGKEFSCWRYCTNYGGIQNCTKKVVQYQPEEIKLQTGVGNVSKWIQTVPTLVAWERNLSLGDAYQYTSALLEQNRARYTLALLAMHNSMYPEALGLLVRALNDERATSHLDFPMDCYLIALNAKHWLSSSSNCPMGKQAVGSIPKNFRELVTEKEADFLASIMPLFPPDVECKDDTEYKREKRFAESARKLVEKQPDDIEARLIDGLVKLGTLHHPECQTEGQKYEACLDEIQTVRDHFKELYESEKYRTHSGLVQYILHAYDAPRLFKDSINKFVDEQIEPEKQKDDKIALGIQAAYDYPKIAQSSVYGLQRPSHIFHQTGNWKMSVKSNLEAIKVWEEYTKARGKKSTYDKENLYHAVEFAQNDLLQLGRSEEAKTQLKRVEDAEKLQDESYYDKEGNNEEVRFFTEYVLTMRARQYLDPWHYTQNAPKSTHGVNSCIPGGVHVVNDDISPRQITYAALAEAGAILASGISAANEEKSPVWKICIKEMEQLAGKLERKKYKETMKYTKHAVNMMKEMLYGIGQLAEAVNEAGNGDIDKNKEESIKEYLEKATTHQDKMERTSVTPTLLFISSYELYGQVLLMLEKYEEACQMFKKSILYRMGRTNSLIGLARCYAMLGNEQKADYFYEYVEKQLEGADEGNLYVKEAGQWAKSKSTDDIRAAIRWPYINNQKN